MPRTFRTLGTMNNRHDVRAVTERRQHRPPILEKNIWLYPSVLRRARRARMLVPCHLLYSSLQTGPPFFLRRTHAPSPAASGSPPAAPAPPRRPVPAAPVHSQRQGGGRLTRLLTQRLSRARDPAPDRQVVDTGGLSAGDLRRLHKAIALCSPSVRPCRNLRSFSWSSACAPSKGQGPPCSLPPPLAP